MNSNPIHQISANVFNVAAPIVERVKPIISALAAPKNIGKLALYTPKILNLLMVESVLNQALREQILDGDFDFLQGHKLVVNLSDAGVYCQLGYHLGRLRALDLCAEKPEGDVLLAVNVADAIDLIQQKVDPDTLFFRRRLKINGSTELAHQVKNTIDTLDPEVIPAIVHKFLGSYQQLIRSSS